MDVPCSYPATRMRRLRQSGWIREIVRDVHLHPQDFILPLFIHDGGEEQIAIASMPNVYRYSIAKAAEITVTAYRKGIRAVALFPVTPANKKTPFGEESFNPDNLICRSIRAIKIACPEIGIIADVALDPYTTHGHDGIIENDYVLNDKTVDILIKQALVQVEAGCDIIAPSDMMDGRIGKIRIALEQVGHHNTLLLSYAAKYASAFYGPFRDAIGSSSALKGDKKTYQMSPHRLAGEALREAALDIHEGADMIMVKPALPYLDILSRLKQEFSVPIFAYQVSGEYSMIWAAHQCGYGDVQSLAIESLTALKRAGATGILTYFALDIIEWIEKT